MLDKGNEVDVIQPDFNIAFDVTNIIKKEEDRDQCMNCMEDKGWARAERATDCAESGGMSLPVKHENVPQD